MCDSHIESVLYIYTSYQVSYKVRPLHNLWTEVGPTRVDKKIIGHIYMGPTEFALMRLDYIMLDRLHIPSKLTELWAHK